MSASTLPAHTNSAERIAQTAQAPDSKTIALKDETVAGLELRVSNKSKKWSLRYRVRNGTNWANRRITLGEFPAVTVTAARKAANSYRADIARGSDPMQAKRDNANERALLAARKTVNDAFQDWAEIELVNRKDAGAEARRMFTKDVLPKLSKHFVADLSRKDVMAVIDPILKRGTPRMAKVVFALLRQFLRFCRSRDLIDKDPSAGISKREIGGEAEERDRVLTLPEVWLLPRLLPNSRLQPASQTAIWIALGTACRIGELLKAEWSHIDFNKRTWLIPAEHSKNGKPHKIHLSDFTLLWLKQLHALSGQYQWLFPNADNNNHIDPKSLTKLLADRQRETGLAIKGRSNRTQSLALPNGQWRPHDLRRTAATLMVSLGVLPEVAERCLNHTEENRVKRTYLRHDYSKEMAAAWECLGLHLSNIIMLKPTHQPTPPLIR